MRINRDYFRDSDPDQNRQFRRMWTDPPGRFWPDVAVGFVQPDRTFVVHAADVTAPDRTAQGVAS